MSTRTSAPAGRRSRPPLWAVEGLAIVRTKRAVLIAVMVLVIAVGLVLALAAPTLVPPTPLVGAAVGLAAILLGMAAAVASDTADLIIRGPRHIAASGGELVAIAPTQARVDLADDLAEAVLAAREEPAPLLLALAAARRDVAATVAWTDALAMALAKRDVSVLTVDLASGRTPVPGLAEFHLDGKRLGEIATIEPGLRLGRTGAGRDLEAALDAVCLIRPRLPRDLDVLLVSLPMPASRPVLMAARALDHVLMVAERDQTSRVDLIAALDALERAGTGAQVVLLDDVTAHQLGVDEPPTPTVTRGRAPEPDPEGEAEGSPGPGAGSGSGSVSGSDDAAAEAAEATSDTADAGGSHPSSRTDGVEVVGSTGPRSDAGSGPPVSLGAGVAAGAVTGTAVAGREPRDRDATTSGEAAGDPADGDRGEEDDRGAPEPEPELEGGAPADEGEPTAVDAGGDADEVDLADAGGAAAGVAEAGVAEAGDDEVARDATPDLAAAAPGEHAAEAAPDLAAADAAPGGPAEDAVSDGTGLDDEVASGPQAHPDEAAAAPMPAAAEPPAPAGASGPAADEGDVAPEAADEPPLPATAEVAAPVLGVGGAAVAGAAATAGAAASTGSAQPDVPDREGEVAAGADEPTQVADLPEPAADESAPAAEVPELAAEVPEPDGQAAGEPSPDADEPDTAAEPPVGEPFAGQAAPDGATVPPAALDAPDGDGTDQVEADGSEDEPAAAQAGGSEHLTEDGGEEDQSAVADDNPGRLRRRLRSRVAEQDELTQVPEPDPQPDPEPAPQPRAAVRVKLPPRPATVEPETDGEADVDLVDGGEVDDGVLDPRRNELLDAAAEAAAAQLLASTGWEDGPVPAAADDPPPATAVGSPREAADDSPPAAADASTPPATADAVRGAGDEPAPAAADAPEPVAPDAPDDDDPTDRLPAVVMDPEPAEPAAADISEESTPQGAPTSDLPAGLDPETPVEDLLLTTAQLAALEVAAQEPDEMLLFPVDPTPSASAEAPAARDEADPGAPSAPSASAEAPDEPPARADEPAAPDGAAAEEPAAPKRSRGRRSRRSRRASGAEQGTLDIGLDTGPGDAAGSAGDAGAPGDADAGADAAAAVDAPDTDAGTTLDEAAPEEVAPDAAPDATTDAASDATAGDGDADDLGTDPAPTGVDPLAPVTDDPGEAGTPPADGDELPRRPRRSDRHRKRRR